MDMGPFSVTEPIPAHVDGRDTSQEMRLSLPVICEISTRTKLLQTDRVSAVHNMLRAL